MFENKKDPGYKKILSMCRRGKRYLQKNKRFDMKGFRPRHAYIREMQRYGVLPDNIDSKGPLAPYRLDCKYWRSLGYRPANSETTENTQSN